ncbi:unnamed protein product [Closterium sp. NIES-53]
MATEVCDGRRTKRLRDYLSKLRATSDEQRETTRDQRQATRVMLESGAVPVGRTYAIWLASSPYVATRHAFQPCDAIALGRIRRWSGKGVGQNFLPPFPPFPPLLPFRRWPPGREKGSSGATLRYGPPPHALPIPPAPSGAPPRRLSSPSPPQRSPTPPSPAVAPRAPSALRPPCVAPSPLSPALPRPPPAFPRPPSPALLPPPSPALLRGRHHRLPSPLARCERLAHHGALRLLTAWGRRARSGVEASAAQGALRHTPSSHATTAYSASVHAAPSPVPSSPRKLPSLFPLRHPPLLMLLSAFATPAHATARSAHVSRGRDVAGEPVGSLQRRVPWLAVAALQNFQSMRQPHEEKATGSSLFELPWGGKRAASREGVSREGASREGASREGASREGASRKGEVMGAPKQKWTAEEEGALRAGVDKYGPGKWRAIQKDPVLGPLLTHRSNVDLKVGGVWCARLGCSMVNKYGSLFMVDKYGSLFMAQKVCCQKDPAEGPLLTHHSNVDLKTKYGPGKWRAIQKDSVLGPLLTHRSNVDLKVRRAGVNVCLFSPLPTSPRVHDKWHNMTAAATGGGSSHQGVALLTPSPSSPPPLPVSPSTGQVAQHDSSSHWRWQQRQCSGARATSARPQGAAGGSSSCAR